jgi:hypothetical protein
MLIFSRAPAPDIIREFLAIVVEQVDHAFRGEPRGHLQLYRINPTDESISVSGRYLPNDLEPMARTAEMEARNGHNVSVETRLVRADLKGYSRGRIEDTTGVFALVVDSDADMGRAGALPDGIVPSLVVETSPGNQHRWLFLEQALAPAAAHDIGERMRRAIGADHDTGVITQGYRVAGTPNYPNKTKQARGRTAVEPTRIISYSGRRYTLEELAAVFLPIPEREHANVAGVDETEADLPRSLLERVKTAIQPGDRSQHFHSVIYRLKERGWGIGAIIGLFRKYPGGAASKYLPDANDRNYVDRLHREVERSHGRVEIKERYRWDIEEVNGTIPEPLRFSVLDYLARSLLRRGVDPGVTLSLLLSHNQVHCRPPFGESDVVAVVEHHLIKKQGG